MSAYLKYYLEEDRKEERNERNIEKAKVMVKKILILKLF